MAPATATATAQQHHQSPGEITTASSPDALSSLGLDFYNFSSSGFFLRLWRCPLAAVPGTISRAAENQWQLIIRDGERIHHSG